MSAPCSTCNSNAHSLGNYCDCFEAIEIKHLKSINDDYMRIRTENESLQARIAELEALTQWQPIETAKDGDLVVLFGGVSYVTVGIVNKSVKKVMSLWTPIPKPPEG